MYANKPITYCYHVGMFFIYEFRFLLFRIISLTVSRLNGIFHNNVRKSGKMFGNKEVYDVFQR